MLAQLGGCPVDQLVETPIVAALARHIVHGDPLNLDHDLRHPALKDEFGVWVPMSAAAHARLSDWRGSALPAWWAMSPVEVAQHIAVGTIDVGKRGDGIPAQDLYALSRGWGVAEQVAIVQVAAGTSCDRIAMGGGCCPWPIWPVPWRVWPSTAGRWWPISCRSSRTPDPGLR